MGESLFLAHQAATGDRLSGGRRRETPCIRNEMDPSSKSIHYQDFHRGLPQYRISGYHPGQHCSFSVARPERRMTKGGGTIMHSLGGFIRFVSRPCRDAGLSRHCEDSVLLYRVMQGRVPVGANRFFLLFC